MRKEFGKPMSGHQALEMYDGQFHKQLDRELKGAERTKCDEKYDIRSKVVSGSPFTASAEKILKAELRHSEKPSVGFNADLHSDTTEMGIDVVTPMKKGGFTSSAEDNVRRQKDKRVPDAVKDRTFQN